MWTVVSRESFESTGPAQLTAEHVHWDAFWVHVGGALSEVILRFCLRQAHWD